MNHRRIHLLLLLIAALMLIACQGAAPSATQPASPSTEESAAADAAASTSAEDIEDTGEPQDVDGTEDTGEPEDTGEEDTDEMEDTTPPVLRVGINLGFRPFVFRDESGNLTGFDIDLINALAGAANFEITYVETPFEGILDRLNSDEYDVVISAITATEEREQRVDFTDIYFESGQALVSYFNAGQGLATRVDDTTIQGAESLTETMQVGVKEATTGDTFATDETNAAVVRYPEAEDALDALLAGEVDAVILDVAVLAKAITDSGQIKLVGPPVTQEEYAIAVAEGDTATRDMLNAALEEIRQNGVYDQLVQQWFGSP